MSLDLPDNKKFHRRDPGPQTKPVTDEELVEWVGIYAVEPNSIGNRLIGEVVRLRSTIQRLESELKRAKEAVFQQDRKIGAMERERRPTDPPRPDVQRDFA